MASLLVLLLALLFGGLGFAMHALWIIGFGVARGAGSGGHARWYRWQYRHNTSPA